MSVPIPSVHASQQGYAFCTAFAAAAAGFYFLGEDASLFWSIYADPNITEVSGSSIDRTVSSMLQHGSIPWSVCPGYGDKSSAWNAVNTRYSEFAPLAKKPKEARHLYYNGPMMDTESVISTLDGGYPILATAALQDLFELDSTGSTRLDIPYERKGESHAVCILPEYQVRPDGIFVRYINSFGSSWGDKGTAWGLLGTNWYQMWSVKGDLYNFGGKVKMADSYSKIKDGQIKLSDNFKVSEFACKDGSDAILIDINLVTALQAIRSHFRAPITIVNAYNTSTYANTIGCPSKNNHHSGMAADVRVAGVAPQEVAKWVETYLLGNGFVGGLGLHDYPNDGFIHIDTRLDAPVQWIQTGMSASTYMEVNSITRHLESTTNPFPKPNPEPTSRTLKVGLNGEDVAELVGRLIELGYAKKLSYDNYVQQAVIDMQKGNGLVADGVFGPKSMKMLELLLNKEG